MSQAQREEGQGGRIGLTLSPSEVAGVILDALLLGSSCETHSDSYLLAV